MLSLFWTTPPAFFPFLKVPASVGLGLITGAPALFVDEANCPITFGIPFQLDDLFSTTGVFFITITSYHEWHDICPLVKGDNFFGPVPLELHEPFLQ